MLNFFKSKITRLIDKYKLINVNNFLFISYCLNKIKSIIYLNLIDSIFVQFVFEIHNTLNLDKIFKLALSYIVNQVFQRVERCSWNGRDCKLYIHFEDGLKLYENKQCTLLWQQRFDKLKRSADNNHNLLWLNFENDEGEIELDVGSSLKPFVFTLHSFLASKLNRISMNSILSNNTLNNTSFNNKFILRCQNFPLRFIKKHRKIFFEAKRAIYFNASIKNLKVLF
ncbi:Beta-1-syntrophin [Brachionus plicatilis]|uniref:Beta-1-syntrophin n=1 Tax=Brachionus plicatilis TaxID=10195 RepID=A0A3M7QZI5_BRAPC|nr:Beta-1-syntrophin [Brachionus plicatilis]